ncbi:hypothetical protein ACRS6B_26705 [Nocardia asteroides]
MEESQKLAAPLAFRPLAFFGGPLIARGCRVGDNVAGECLRNRTEVSIASECRT